MGELKWKNMMHDYVIDQNTLQIFLFIEDNIDLNFPASVRLAYCISFSFFIFVLFYFCLNFFWIQIKWAFPLFTIYNRFSSGLNESIEYSNVHKFFESLFAQKRLVYT